MIEPVIYTKIPFSDPALIDEARNYQIADLHEALGAIGGQSSLMNRQMRPINTKLRIVGPAITVYSFPGDNLMMHRALHLAQRGHILVCTHGGGGQGALWGDHAAMYAQRKGIAGIIIEGNIRDLEQLIQMNDPVWCTGVWAGTAARKNIGAINVPIVCAGALVNPGDIIAADADGVLVIPRRLLRMSVEGARARVAKEPETRRKLEAGGPVQSLESIEAVLSAAGVKTHEKTWEEDEGARRT
jgi:4-hydroxy-4-methyl-2-oxoglutarate aldolase